MLLEIQNLLSSEDIRACQAILANEKFQDGKLSAGAAAQTVKQNQEVPQSSPALEQLNNLVMGKLLRHPIYQNGVFAKHVAAPFYARYTQGMHYGDHIDDPIMGPPQGRYRPDVSITIFLNAPEDYQGGELTINTAFGEQDIKLPAGHAVLYPSGSLHRVKEVQAGMRLVAVTWAQSLIREAADRELLFGLNQARESLLAQDPGSPTAKQVDHAYINLVRKWVDM